MRTDIVNRTKAEGTAVFDTGNLAGPCFYPTCKKTIHSSCTRAAGQKHCSGVRPGLVMKTKEHMAGLNVSATFHLTNIFLFPAAAKRSVDLNSGVQYIPLDIQQFKFGFQHVALGHQHLEVIGAGGFE